MTLTLASLCYALLADREECKEWEHAIPQKTRIGAGKALADRYLKEKSQTHIADFWDQTEEHQYVFGEVQSGKSNEIISYILWSIFVCKRRVLVVVRNATSDSEQLWRRLSYFVKGVHLEHILKKVKIILMNKIRISAYLGKSRKAYNICVDEADLIIRTDSSEPTEFEQLMGELIERSKHATFITATPYALFVRAARIGVALPSVFKMIPGANYKGLKQIEHVHVESRSAEVRNGQPDLNIPQIYDEFLAKEHGIILHNVTRVNKTQNLVAKELRGLYTREQFEVIVFNGQSIILHGTRGKYAKSISVALQQLKDAGVSHVCIIAGAMADRGVSFVSSDYEWHLTDQYYTPPVSAHSESVTQAIRLFGCYNDSRVLTLWTMDWVWEKLNEYHKLTRRMVRKRDLHRVTTRLHPGGRLTRPAISRGTGWQKTENKYKFRIV
jgi:hypothetical protein